MLSYSANLRSESDGEELNLDLPVRKNKNVVLESSDGSSDSGIVDSDLDSNSQTSAVRKKSEKKRILSRDYIDNSDFDENPLTWEEIERNERELEEISEAKVRKSTKKEDFVKASEDFKSTLKFIDDDDSSEDDSGLSSGTDNEREEEPVIKVRKPKETLKKVLKESEALLRRSIPVELEVQVPKPKSLSLILNEALATNSRTPTEAKKRVIDEKRRLQRQKLEKILGAERLAALSKDEPQIGQFKLDETVEIEIETVDEKANEGDEIAREVLKVKLTDLPDKHFDGRNNVKSNDSNSSYKIHIQSQKKASIELLNAQLQEKIRAQSNAMLLHHQRAHAAHIAAQRAKAAERERKRKENEVRKERENWEKKEKKVGGGELFKKKEYGDIERPPTVDDNEDEMEMVVHKKPARIILSDDEDGEGEADYEQSDIESGDDDLLNLDRSDDELPDVNEAMDEMMNLLSGKFTEEQQEVDVDENQVIANSSSKTKSASLPSVRIKSEFIDDEASDEDEERENDDIDEEALQEEMMRSNFIVSDAESEADSDAVRAYANEQARREDMQKGAKLMAQFAGHLDEEEDELLNSLGNKYGLVEGDRPVQSHKRALSSYQLDEDIRNLLDPIEQKRRKLAALGSLNILNRPRLVEAADDEFEFKKSRDLADCSSDYYATTDDDVDSDGGFYEEVESGLQSRVEAMLDEEMLDGEEVQVQATEALNLHIQNLPIDHSTDIMANDENTAHKIVVDNLKQNTTTRRGMAVPSADARLKSRLLALQQENDEIASNDNKFKGFSISKK